MKNIVEIVEWPEYEAIAKRLIEREEALTYVRMSDCKIVCLRSDEVRLNKAKKRVYAEIEKVPSKYAWATTATYTITVFYPNIAYFSEAQINIVILRELLKIAVSDKGDGLFEFGLNEYDLQDFKLVIDRYGSDWDKDDLFSTSKHEENGLFSDIEDFGSE